MSTTVSLQRYSPQLLKRLPTWKPMTLQALFRGAEKPRTRKPSARAMEEEEILMEALADEIEDTFPDDGAIEVDSDEEYIGYFGCAKYRLKEPANPI
ncbi:hypothetical protein B0H10DRAFT_2429452 [Mycena sp. CBHHK59/15]|nr:hypothetical protein B0H10DRAFT_2429452 [Mycena sp. CBHHK59/15]